MVHHKLSEPEVACRQKYAYRNVKRESMVGGVTQLNGLFRRSLILNYYL